MIQNKNEYMHAYEEYRTLPSKWGWALIIVLSIILIGTSMMAQMFIPDVRRQWDFGQLPIAPAESRYTSDVVQYVIPVPRQIPPLPDALAPVQYLPPSQAGYEREQQF